MMHGSTILNILWTGKIYRKTRWLSNHQEVWCNIISNPETVLIPTTLLKAEKKSQNPQSSHLPSDRIKFGCWKFLSYKGHFTLTSQEEDPTISPEDCQNSGSARAALSVTSSVLFPKAKIPDVHTLVYRHLGHVC